MIEMSFNTDLLVDVTRQLLRSPERLTGTFHDPRYPANISPPARKHQGLARSQIFRPTAGEGGLLCGFCDLDDWGRWDPSLEVIRKGVDETVGLWRWDRLTAFFRSDQPQVTITQAPVVFLNRFLCIVVLSFSFRPVFFWSGRPGRLQALARPPLADPHDMIEVVSQHLFHQFGAHRLVLPAQ